MTLFFYHALYVTRHLRETALVNPDYTLLLGTVLMESMKQKQITSPYSMSTQSWESICLDLTCLPFICKTKWFIYSELIMGKKWIKNYPCLAAMILLGAQLITAHSYKSLECTQSYAKLIFNKSLTLTLDFASVLQLILVHCQHMVSEIVRHSW